MYQDWFNIFRSKDILYGVPLHSVLVPILFSLYTTPLSKVIGKHSSIKFHFYAGDTQLFIHLPNKNVIQSFERLKRYLDGVKCLLGNNLKLSPDKTKLITLGTKLHYEKISALLPAHILNDPLHSEKVVKIFEVLFNSDFSFS